MPLLEKDQRTDQWLAARRGKITASVAAACLGLDPWMSRQAAWRSITGRGKKADNKHMSWGREYEAQARSDYEAESGNIVQETGFWIHPKIDWLGASPDGLAGVEGLVEIKCPGKVPTAVPIHNRIQMLVQLEVTQRQWCDYYAWTHNGAFLRRVYPAGTAGLLAKLFDFHMKYVFSDTPPPRKRRKK